MQADQITATLGTPAPVSLPEADQIAIKIVMCDEAGRPRSGRVLRVSACLGALPLSFGSAA